MVHDVSRWGSEPTPDEDGPPAAPELELYRATAFWDVFSIGLSAALLVGLVALLVLDGATVGEWLLTLVGGPAMASVMVESFQRLLDGRPLLELGRDGLAERSALGGVETFVQWDEVVDVEPGPYGTIRVHVQDPDRHLGKAGPLRRFRLRGTVRRYGTPFLLPTDLRTSDGRPLDREGLEEALDAALHARLRETVAEERARLESGDGPATDPGHSSSQAYGRS